MPKVEIRVKGQIDPEWSETFGGLTIRHSNPDEAVLTGTLPDQAAVYGVIGHLRDLGLGLLLVRIEPGEADGPQAGRPSPRGAPFTSSPTEK